MKRLKNLDQLVELALQKKCVLLPKRMSQRHWPAAFIISMQIMYVYKLLKEGIYIYEPKKK